MYPGQISSSGGKEDNVEEGASNFLYFTLDFRKTRENWNMYKSLEVRMK